VTSPNRVSESLSQALPLSRCGEAARQRHGCGGLQGEAQAGCRGAAEERFGVWPRGARGGAHADRRFSTIPAASWMPPLPRPKRVPADALLLSAAALFPQDQLEFSPASMVAEGRRQTLVMMNSPVGGSAHARFKWPEGQVRRTHRLCRGGGIGTSHCRCRRARLFVAHEQSERV
jgi:hypothetical protein